jgi:hypothetical protein
MERPDASACNGLLTLRQCTSLLKPLLKMDAAVAFLQPVDPVALRLPDYNDIVKQPMDLGTIQKKLDGGSYLSVEDFINDVRLVWYNACIYNPADQWVHQSARKMEAEFEHRLASLIGMDPVAPAGGLMPVTRTPSAELANTILLSRVKAILKSLNTNQSSICFRKPVDPEAMGIPHYRDIIKRPMDLQTVGERLEQVRRQGQRMAVARVRG